MLPTPGERQQYIDNYLQKVNHLLAEYGKQAVASNDPRTRANALNECERLKKCLEMGEKLLNDPNLPLDLLPSVDGPTVIAPFLVQHNYYETASPGQPYVPPNDFAWAVDNFVGRETELADIRAGLQAARPVVLSGPGGIGKTALCRQAAFECMRENPDRFPDGAVLLDGRGLTVGEEGRAGLLNLLAPRFGLDKFTSPGYPGQWQEVQNLLRGKKALLVLDNAEGEIIYHDLAGFVATTAPGLGLLVNAREQPADPTLTARVDHLKVDKLPRLAAVGLFRQRAGLKDEPGRQPEVETVLQELCGPEYLDGMPLAILLAAASLPPNAPLAALRGLQHALGQNLLRPLRAYPGMAGVADHHKSVQAAFDLSLERLAEDERLAFETICLIPGPDFQREAMGAAADLDPNYAPALTRLERASLLGPAPTGRYTLHALLKDYGLQLLRARPDGTALETAAQDRLIEHYRALADSDYSKFADGEKLRRQGLEWASFRGCLVWCNQAPTPARLAAQYDMLQSLQSYINLAGRWAEGRHEYEEALSRNRAADELHRCGWLLYHIAWIQADTGQYEQALTGYREALKLARQLGDRRGEAATLHQLGNIDYAQGRYDDATTLYQQSLAIKQQLGDRRGEAGTLHQLGNIDYDQGRYDDATTLYRQSLAITQQLGDRQGEATTLHALGMIASDQGRYDQATTLYRQSLAITQQLDNRRGEADTLHQLGSIDYAQGRYDQATTLYRQSLAIKHQLGNRQGEAGTLHALGNIDYAQGRYDQATTLYRQSLAIKHQLGDRRGEAATLHQLGMIDYAQGRYDQATTLYQQSLAIRQQLGHQQGEAMTLGMLGQLLIESQPEQARAGLAMLEKALAISRELGLAQTAQFEGIVEQARHFMATRHQPEGGAGHE